MKYCKRCLQPDTRPKVLFDENQICYACKFEDEKKKIDWKAREESLRSIAVEAQEKAKKEGAPYDCVIGVSGGKDSTFQALYAKEKLALRPLLVNFVPNRRTELGRKNLQNLCAKGFDMISLVADPIIAQKLARRSFYEKGNAANASEYALWASAWIIADKFNIPLIIQGENAALTLGVAQGSVCDGDAFGVVTLDTLQGCSAKDLVNAEITLRDLYFYDFPDLKKMIEKGIKAIWLQYYVKEWSQVFNADFAVARGLQGRQDDLHDIGRYRRYTALDSDRVIVNQMLKYLKFGFGFATDEACYDIREGRLSREDAILLVKEYDGKCSQKYIDIFCDSLGITESEFWRVVDTFVNKKLFKKDKNGKWQPKFEVGVDFVED
ncbi:MAG: N-acetyl sugar amidotransferase [Bdellovibrionota bacterium]|jgi:N-acetyl sugar amidotransferase